MSNLPYFKSILVQHHAKKNMYLWKFILLGGKTVSDMTAGVGIGKNIKELHYKTATKLVIRFKSIMNVLNNI